MRQLTVFDIACILAFITRSREFVQDGLNRLPDNISQHVQPSTMRHTHRNMFDSMVDTTINQCLHTGNERLTALKTKSFFSGEFRRDELLEELGPHESVEDHALFGDSVRPGCGDFDAFTNPVALVFVGDVYVLDTNVTACGLEKRRARTGEYE